MSNATYTRQPGESTAAFRGRERRERNDAVDALNLKEGDPIVYAGKFVRFSPARHTRADRSYGWIRRCTATEAQELVDRETHRAEQDRISKEHREEYDAFHARPEVQAANSVRHYIESHLKKIVDRLTPDEWTALAAKLTP